MNAAPVRMRDKCTRRVGACGARAVLAAPRVPHDESMTESGRRQLEENIARCRVVLAVAAILVVYADSETPLLSRWIHLDSGAFTIDARIFAVMGTFLAYSIAIYHALGRRLPISAAPLTTWLDVLFGLAVAAVTAGITGPSFPFLAFAVMTSSLRGSLGQATLVTVASVLLYVAVGLLSAGGADAFVMRPIDLGVSAYLVGHLGRQTLDLHEKARTAEVEAQRHRIARDLHDGYAQALSGISLRLEASRRMLAADRAGDALRELTDLQQGVNHEHDQLRHYVRSLAGVQRTTLPLAQPSETRVHLRATMSGSLDVVDHVLGVVREALTNIRRHAHASSALVEIQENGVGVQVEIEDDGVGFKGETVPWAIASRVRQAGGDLRLANDEGTGVHLRITIPEA
jgi:signal transduction histidine kinase